jgi:hypothetical protein
MARDALDGASLLRLRRPVEILQHYFIAYPGLLHQFLFWISVPR